MASANKLAGNERAEFAGQLAYPTTNGADLLPPAVANEASEEATEFGEPRGISDPTCLTLDYCWKDFDSASRMTWKYLREVDSERHLRWPVGLAVHPMVSGSLPGPRQASFPSTLSRNSPKYWRRCLRLAAARVGVSTLDDDLRDTSQALHFAKAMLHSRSDRT
jgi:hypothetical protein